jgi:hypothetical protein
MSASETEEARPESGAGEASRSGAALRDAFDVGEGDGGMAHFIFPFFTIGRFYVFCVFLARRVDGIGE